MTIPKKSVTGKDDSILKFYLHFYYKEKHFFTIFKLKIPFYRWFWRFSVLEYDESLISVNIVAKNEMKNEYDI